MTWSDCCIKSKRAKTPNPPTGLGGESAWVDHIQKFSLVCRVGFSQFRQNSELADAWYVFCALSCVFSVVERLWLKRRWNETCCDAGTVAQLSTWLSGAIVHFCFLWNGTFKRLAWLHACCPSLKFILRKPIMAFIALIARTFCLAMFDILLGSNLTALICRVSWIAFELASLQCGWYQV